jgi:hypothetical protein
VFATLDLESGFWQVPITEHSSEILTFATPYGRFQYTRLPFGIASAPEEFHRRVVNAMAGIKGVLVYIDDIVIFAKTKEEHDQIVAQVLEALKRAGFTVNDAKCQFNQKRIKFLGNIVTEGKIYPDPEKLEAIRNYPVPKNAKELRGYVGLVGWIRKFRSDLIVSLKPFRSLLTADIFDWRPEHTAAMEEINNKISDNLSLELFRPGEPLELWTDASPYGYGAILLQNKKPLYCASRTLTKAEANYPQIDLELGAIAWAFERMDTFVYGSTVQVYTDHKPLTAITKKEIGELSIRQQRMMARLMRYDFEVNYVSAKLMDGPDALSRAPLKLKDSDERHPRNPLVPDGTVEDIFISELHLIDLADPLIEKIRQHADKDKQYQQLVQAAKEGFPAHSKWKVDEFWSIRDQIYESNNLVFRNRELIIPLNYRDRMIRVLHQGHHSKGYMLRRAKGNVFWPGMEEDFKDFFEKCEYCQINKPSQQKQPMLSITVPSAPGLEVGSDYLSNAGKEHVLFVDLFSGWTEYFPASTRRPETLIKQFQTFMARNGIPRKIYADQGSAYESKEFHDFCDEWGIEVITCSGEYPKGNGTAEAAVKRVKKWIKSAENHGDLSKSILAWHQTPLAPGRPTPAQLHLGRNLRDELNLQVVKADVDWARIQEWKQAQKATNAETYDKRARELAPLRPGQKVFVQIHGKRRRGEILEVAKRPRSYILRMTDTGSKLERNRIHLREDRTGHANSGSGCLYFFSGKETSTNNSSAVERRLESDEHHPTEHPRRREPEPEPEPEPRSQGSNISSDGNVRHEEQRPNKTMQKKKPTDREKEFLEKEKVSKFGRVSKNVKPFSPSW